jgi:hypothetical protein
MSSRRLLVLVSALPDDSAFASSVRDGDWSVEEYLRAATVNELRSLRVDQASLQGQKLEMTYVESPSQVADREEDAEEKQQIRAQILMHLGVSNEEESDE